MSERQSYPAADNIEYVLQSLQFLQQSVMPVTVLRKLTKKYQHTYPIMYGIFRENHLSSDYFELLKMLGLCEITKKESTWYFYNFTNHLANYTNFQKEELQREICDIFSDFKMKKKISVYNLTETGKNQLSLEDDFNSLINLFKLFYHLKPDYFRYFIQSHNINIIKSNKIKDLSMKIYSVIKRKYNHFAKDDVGRIIGWCRYFQILKYNEDSKMHYFDIKIIIHYIGNVLTSYINNKNIKTFIMEELEKDLVTNLFFEDSIINIEGLFEVIMDQNRENIKWGTLERGKYKGFKRDQRKQALEIINKKLIYNFDPNIMPKVIIL